VTVKEGSEVNVNAQKNKLAGDLRIIAIQKKSRWRFSMVGSGEHSQQKRRGALWRCTHLLLTELRQAVLVIPGNAASHETSDGGERADGQKGGTKARSAEAKETNERCGIAGAAKEAAVHFSTLCAHFAERLYEHFEGGT
jgi:hypothetical protein